MPFTMYQASVPVFIRNLGNLAEILRKATAHAEAKKIDLSVLAGARLYPDMLPLTKQVQLATDQAKNSSSRLSGAERPTFEDNETTFDELQARIAKTVAYLESLQPAQFEGSEERDITLPLRDREATLKGAPYLLGFVHPNFYFHLATAYAILRENGVEIGKLDFLGPLPA